MEQPAQQQQQQQQQHRVSKQCYLRWSARQALLYSMPWQTALLGGCGLELAARHAAVWQHKHNCHM
jgi:hypothetical protein